MEQNIATAYPDPVFYKCLCRNYLKIISEATKELSNNKGTLRKDIWEYLLNHYAENVEYRDFLVSIRRLLGEGKIFSENGYYHVEPSVYREIWEHQLTFTKPRVRGKSKKDSASIVPNLTQKALQSKIIQSTLTQNSRKGGKIPVQKTLSGGTATEKNKKAKWGKKQ